jgi:molecular chaperone GrpE (heat shock protein)
MLNFEDELNKLLFRETERLPQYEAAELAAAGQELLAELNKKQTDVSLQIEEIYDLVKEQDTRIFQETIDAEKARSSQLVYAAMALSGLLEDFCTYAEQGGSEELKHQANLLWEHSGSILGDRGIFRFGAAGEFLNPQIHTVKASVESSLPREQVVRVLESGYAYQGLLLKKAAVVVSRGPEEREAEDTGPDKTGDYGENDEFEYPVSNDQNNDNQNSDTEGEQDE